MTRRTSIGTVMGNLIEVGFGSGSRFYIHPPIGAESIACHFPKGMERVAKASACKKVRVHGRKYFMKNTGLPFRIDADRIEAIHVPKAFTKLKPNQKYTGEPADRQIAMDRNEW